LANTAQDAIDAMETQVVLDSDGLTIRAADGDPDLVTLGTTLTFFDGTGDASANRRLVANSTGVTIFGGPASGNDFMTLAAGSIIMKSNNLKKFEMGDTGAFIYGAAEDDFVNVKADAVDVVAANTIRASFGATTTIGVTSTEHVKITSSGLELKDGGTVLASYGGTTTIGVTSGNHVSITSTTLKLKNGSTDIISLAEGAVTVSGSILEKTKLFGDGSDGVVAITSNTSLARDMYYKDLTVTSCFLTTKGFRIFVKDTLHLNAATIRHNGTGGTAGAAGGDEDEEGGANGGNGGAGASAGSLQAGTAGSKGGASGIGDAHGGGGGGGGGGSGGIVFIYARVLQETGTGTITVTGGVGGQGGNGGT